MGLKEMLDKQRAMKEQQNATQSQTKVSPTPPVGTNPTPQNSQSAATVSQSESIKSRLQLRGFGQNRTPSAPAKVANDAGNIRSGTGGNSGLDAGPAQITEKKDEKITTPSPGPAAAKQMPENGNSGKVVEKREANPIGTESNIRNGNGPISGSKPADASPIAIGQPSDSPAGLEELRKNIAFLSANIDQKELVGQVVRRVLIDLKKNPQFSTHLTDVDFNTITRAFRRSAVVAARKKTEARETKAKKKAGDNEFADFMANSGMKNFDLGGGGGGGNGWS